MVSFLSAGFAIDNFPGAEINNFSVWEKRIRLIFALFFARYAMRCLPDQGHFFAINISIYRNEYSQIFQIFCTNFPVSGDVLPTKKTRIMDNPQSSELTGELLTRVGNIEVVAYQIDERMIEYRYINARHEREVLYTRENLEDGLISILDFDREFWNSNSKNLALKTPYKLLVLIKDRLLYITPD